MEGDKQEILLPIVKKQVEFYFGDSNYPTDKFLRETSQKYKDNYIPIKVILSFKRMKELTQDAALVVKALEGSEVVEVDPTGNLLKRKQPLPSVDTSLPRCVYTKKWPLDTTLEKAQEFFSQFGKVLAVRFRYCDKKSDTKDKPRKFKGSLLVEFSTVEEAQNVLTSKPIYNDNQLEYLTKQIWQQEKREHINQAILKSKVKEKKKEKEKEKEKENEQVAREYPKGLVLSFSGLGSDVDMKTVKEAFGQHWNVAFVHLEEGKGSGFVRFAEAQSATEALEKMKDTLIGKSSPKMELVTGDDEKKFWEEAYKAMNEAFKNKQGRGRGGRFQRRGNRRGGGGGGEGGSRGGGKRKASEGWVGSSSSKKTKTT